MTTIVTRAGKGSPLTHTEVDTNFTNLNTAKLETAAIPLGTAAAPSVSFLSDANTGIYSPAADQVAVATNGTGRLFIDASGNIGVAAAASTWNLGNTLEVSGTKPVALWNPGDGFNALSNLYYNSAYKFKTTGGYGLYYQQNTTNGAHIFTTTTATGSADGTATFSETLRITSAGLVGIGTSTPTNTSKLEIQTSSTTAPGLWVQTGGTTSAYPIVDVRNGANLDIFAIKGDGTSYFQGKLGIGSTGPTKSLEVAAGATSGNGILVTGSSSPQILLTANSSVSLSMQADASAGYFGTFTNHPLNFRTNNQDRAQIDTSGRLLVGTTSNSGGATCQVVGSVQASNTFRLPSNTKNAGTCKPIAIETISTDGGNNNATVYGNSRYGAGKWVLLAAFNASGDAVAAGDTVGDGSTFVYCITNAATNFPTT